MIIRPLKRLYLIVMKKILHSLLQKRNRGILKKSKLFANKNAIMWALVLIHEDNTPTQHWVLGRIIKVYPRRDDIVRVDDVRAITGILRRPIRKLALVPIKRLFQRGGMFENFAVRIVE